MFRRMGLRRQQKSQHDQKYQPPDPSREEVEMRIYYLLLYEIPLPEMRAEVRVSEHNFSK